MFIVLFEYIPFNVAVFDLFTPRSCVDIEEVRGKKQQSSHTKKEYTHRNKYKKKKIKTTETKQVYSNLIMNVIRNNDVEQKKKKKKMTKRVEEEER